MKHSLLILALLISQWAIAEAKQIKIGVSGMVCSFCAQGITKKFKQEASVDSVDVKLGDKLVTLTTKDKQDLSDDRIKQILTDAGYNVSKIERK